jgi:hypothetical protein
MTQRDFNRQVARATGEFISTIANMGFVPLTARPVEIERRPLIVDWDQLHNSRESYFPSACAAAQCCGMTLFFTTISIKEITD